MKHTLTTAARATSVSRSTIHRAIQSGKLSATKNEEGEYRIDPAELHRVYPAVPEHPKQDDLKQSETRNDTSSEMAADLLDMVQAKDSQLEKVQAELNETKERLAEHREAARLLMSPEDFKAKLSKAIKAEKAEQAKQEQQWQKAIADRKLEIQQARAEADEIRQREIEHLEALKSERNRVAALESRGLIARLFNKKPEPVG